jgi:hypothetical protein
MAYRCSDADRSAIRSASLPWRFLDEEATQLWIGRGRGIQHRCKPLERVGIQREMAAVERN